MALYRKQNQQIYGGNHAMWWLIKTVVDAGWTIPMSGSGTSGLYTTGNVFNMAQLPKQWSLLDPNGVGIGSEPWGHPNCWAVLEDPGGNRQYIIRRDAVTGDNNDLLWHVGYSHGGRFGEGQIPGTDWDEGTEPTAPDIVNLLGSPTTEGTLWQAGGSYSFVDVVADSTPSPAGEYGFLIIEFDSVNSSRSCFIVDDVRNAPVGHPHPLAMGLRNNNPGTLFNATNLNENWNFTTWRDLGGGGEAWVTVNYPWYRWGGASSLNPQFPLRGGVGADGKERAMAALVGFENSVGYMGISRWIKWSGVAREYPGTANGGKDVFIDQALFKDLLDGTEPPLTM